jgi:hypothetical protein
MLGSWHVPSYVAIRRGALKPSRYALSGELSRDQARLFNLGHLGSSPSSLDLSWSARVPT